MEELKKIFHEKFCYEMMNFDGSNRHFYIMPTVVDKPQIIIDWIVEYEKQIADKSWTIGYEEATETHQRLTKIQIEAVCKRQRKICADVYLKEKDYIVQNTTISFAILNTPSPEEKL